MSTRRLAVLVLLLTGLSSRSSGAQRLTADLCIYGATPSGVVAAVAGRERGLSVVVVEPGRWVGGILGAGLKPTQDCPTIEATGGLTRRLLETLGQPKVGERLPDYRLSPAAVRADLRSILLGCGARVIFDHRVSRCEMADGGIVSGVFDRAPFDENGCPPEEAEIKASLVVEASIYLDASYEGDLMERAGVSFRIGRESAAEYDETYAGRQRPTRLTPIDPFVRRGDPSSGLLPGVEPLGGDPVGAADHVTQAYNYRLYLTDDPARRVPITPPDVYDAADYELVGRYVEHLKAVSADEESLMQSLSGIFPGARNQRDYNYQRQVLISIAPLGISHQYAAGDYRAKARVWRRHRDYLRGLHHFLSTDSRVPGAFRERTRSLGLQRDIHPDTKGWPHQLYIRVSRRLTGRYTVTEHDVYNRTEVADPIGLAQYGIDVYPTRRVWFESGGQPVIALEGPMFVGGSKGPTNTPYPIPYRAITPREEECRNLLVPVCFSASHVGYASARMEPVFMICGESAAIAAGLAIEAGVSVQAVDPADLGRSLLAAGQKLSWP